MENKELENMNDISLPETENTVENAAPAEPEQKLDDARRVKALSPSVLVAKRFFRNKLAITGLVILIILFLFCFVGAAIYPYSESQVFMTLKTLQFDYSFGKINEEYGNVYSENSTSSATFRASVNSIIKDMRAKGQTTRIVDGYTIRKGTDEIYTVSFSGDVTVYEYLDKEKVATYTVKGAILQFKAGSLKEELKNLLSDDYFSKGDAAAVSVEYEGNTYTLENGSVVVNYSTPKFTVKDSDLPDGFDAAVAAAEGSFTFEGKTYVKTADAAKTTVTTYKTYIDTIATTLVFDRYDLDKALSDEFRFNAFYALSNNAASFTADGKTYNVAYPANDNTLITYNDGASVVKYVEASVDSIRRYSGQDAISVSTKKAMSAAMRKMIAENKREDNVTIVMEAIDEQGNYVYNEDGTIKFEEENFYIKSEEKGTGQQFVFRNMQEKTVADVDALPNEEHVLGLDSQAMDVLARIMYGGRVSLMIGFIVVFLEIVLGTIMGGISGYFGGFVDNLIMRIVDVFYCIPTMPILIILGAMFNSLKLPNLERVIWLMAVLGFLSWPGIARLVRGQILSLREQDFMTAAEASGLTNRRKIFKHLVPNVIPQLIVQATMGLGGVILMESTLSFLGLGVKYPMATWGQIINSVNSLSQMQQYAYIWVPVGGLICLAVIAFNFVGDGLRDAFDPKMNR